MAFQPDCLLAGKYRLGRKLGGGSFGEIYLGETAALFATVPWGSPPNGSLTPCVCYPGTNIQTGEEVGVKLVRMHCAPGLLLPSC